MGDKKFCDKCNEEIKSQPYGYFNVGIEPATSDILQEMDSDKYSCVISTRGELCLRCYKKLINFLRDK